jgi:hypothetical protein
MRALKLLACTKRSLSAAPKRANRVAEELDAESIVVGTSGPPRR